jgi:fibronectin type 3 domain-containing protein
MTVRATYLWLSLGLTLLAGCGGGSGSGSSLQVNSAVPSVPAGVTASAATTNQLTLAWQPVSGATSYNLYWSTTSGVTTATGTKLARVSSPYLHNGLSPNTTYYYIVTALNGAGESSPSGQMSAATAAAAVTAPAIPSAAAALGGTNQVTLSWNPVSTATSYNVYWTNDPSHVMKDMGATKISGVTSPFRHTSLAAGTVYAYVVTALNTAGESSESEIASAVTSTLDGVTLYGTRCSGCHNPLNISEKKGRTSTQIKAAISANRGGMGSLSTLSTAEIQAIADALGF